MRRVADGGKVRTLSDLPSQVESLLADELASRSKGFARSLGDLVAKQGPSGLRWSTSLLNEMEEEGRRELRARADDICGVGARSEG